MTPHFLSKRRMKKKQKQTLTTLPLELIREILLRLPVKSVLRLKCACKSFLSLISDPQFVISHYTLAASPTHRIILRSNDFYAQSIATESVFKTRSRDMVCFPLPLPSITCLRLDDFRIRPKILGSCRGLVLLYYNDSANLILWNPSLGRYKRLPNYREDITLFPYGFGYDSSKDEYLLILIRLPKFGPETRADIFSFKTESWKTHTIVNDPLVRYKVEDRIVRARSLLNGALHWFVFSERKEDPVIIAFDIVEMTLSDIPLFDRCTVQKDAVYGLRIRGGCLSVCCSVPGCEMTDIWVMKEYKVRSSWTKAFVIHTSNQILPICTIKDGEIFGSNWAATGRLEKRNHKGELLEHFMDSKGLRFSCANLQSAMYTESLLPLPTSFWETSEDDCL